MPASIPSIRLAQSLILQIPLPSIRTAAISFDHKRLNLKPGMNLLARERGYPPECLRSPAKHLALLTEKGRIGTGLIITQTYRNCVQNPRCPLYTKEYGICQRAGEEVTRSERPYYGIAYLAGGGFRGMAVDFRRAVPSEVSWWAGGVPVVWNGQVLRPERMASEVADFCHLWRLRLRGPARRPEDAMHFGQLSALFEKYRHADAELAGSALWQTAIRLGLEREEGYLHNAVGVGPDCLVIVVANASLERLGELAAAAGATEAIVVDNGGSVQVAFRRPGRKTPLVPLAQSYYFREPTIALAAYELDWTDPNWLPIVGGSGETTV